MNDDKKTFMTITCGDSKIEFTKEGLIKALEEYAEIKEIRNEFLKERLITLLEFKESKCDK